MIGNRNLNDIIDIDLLKSIQDRLAEITGLAYNIVDFKGNPINNYSNFCDFCSKVRNTKEGMKICYDTNAHAGLEAAIRQKPYVFKCPAGLVDVAIPIIVNGNYLGAVFFGQIRTNKDKLEPIRKSNYYSKMCRNDDKLLNDFNNTKFIDYSKIESIYSLVNIIVNLLVEKSELSSIQEELSFNNIKLIREKQERKKLEEKLKFYELDSLETPISFEFILNTLNTISSLALIEDAPKTQEMIYFLTKLFRYNFKNIGNLVSIGKAIENIKTYLKIQSTRFGERIRYEINIDEKINDIKIPTMIFLPFIEYSILNGLCPKKDGGTIFIKGECCENNATILIQDNGIGISEDELFSILNGKCKKGSLGSGIYNANNVLVKYYGKEYKVNIKSQLNIGTNVSFKLPL
ncbi:histidine kinase [Clostridium botulinum]|uniref:sensor histidine kinase n=1 Tax=Clostridium TaxID=1485 RepID=UPI000500DD45|nr:MULTISPECIES: PocR ligand-binding domain-containing protein [unclassified Clostridium]AIY78583.1 histidine kinase family protein [Clostridium botulinum 202F]KAI3344671.1 PocR ligand-binding domain-containing protein [Clostridium botulinum]KFX55025.1 histidine kinase [Clostridium botulinum]KFX56299.1 histidine kinase [Clostridium botulinum]KON12036.1 histidine kinase [Clostridium botulinum]